MDDATFLEAIRDESAALVAAAESAGLDRPIPSCPGWTAADLLGHIGRVQRWAVGLVERRSSERDFTFEDPPSDPAALPDWARSGTTRILEVFEATPPDVAIWTMPGPGEVRFWFRRQAHEAALHRVDVELASGSPTPIERDLAGDGIDEFLDVIVPLRLGEQLVGTGESLHFHCTDGDGEWLVRLTPSGPEVEHIHSKGDVAVRGTASDLLLVQRNRIGLDSVEVFGDAALLARWHELAWI